MFCAYQSMPFQQVEDKDGSKTEAAQQQDSQETETAVSDWSWCCKHLQKYNYINRLYQQNYIAEFKRVIYENQLNYC